MLSILPDFFLLIKAFTKDSRMVYRDPGHGTKSNVHSAPLDLNLDNLNLSFGGCGFLGIYHVGVAAAFRTLVPHSRFGTLAGTSAGALAAVALLSEVNPSE